MTPYYQDDRATLYNGDCLAVLRTLPDASVDAAVTDPPYGLAFMGKKWDYDVPTVELWAECLRVLKPGGHLLAFAGTRTQHRMACRIEDAGFEIRDMIAWVYGSGFPKSHNLGGEWSGWGTALKPALEPITLARKPLAGTVAQNVLSHGTGALNVDGCRVGTDGATKRSEQAQYPLTIDGKEDRSKSGARTGHEILPVAAGRWPANLIHDGSPEVLAEFPQSVAGTETQPRGKGGIWSPSTGAPAGPQYGDTGSAARFYYCAKASKADRDEGCEGMAERRGGSEVFDPANRDGVGTERQPLCRNHHPTVKPTDLMRYLCRLVTPPGGLVLDPFTGSGTTGKAALLEGFRFIGSEREAYYSAIAKARMQHAARQPTLFDPQPVQQEPPMLMETDNG